MGVESWSVELCTDRLVLREFVTDDAAGVHAIVGDERVTRWLSFDSRSLTEVRALLAGVLARQAAVPRTEFYLAVAEPTRRADIIGFVRLGLGGVQAADLGYAIRHDQQGCGYAREACRTMLDFGFGELGLHRITVNIGPDNTASLRLAGSLGFIYEGTVRDHVYTNGAWRNSELFSLLAHEWQALTSSPD